MTDVMTDHVLPDLHGGALDDLADPLLGDGARAAVHRQPLQGAAQQAWLAAAGGLAAVADRVAGAYLGLALGDALGATVEFMTPREIALRHGVHQQICGGGWLRLKAGQVTDDTTMSLALGEGLLHGAAASDGRSLDLGEVAESFLLSLIHI